MPTLPEILREHAPLLVIDAASRRVQVGLFPAVGKSAWIAHEAEAGVAVFRAIEELGVDLDSIRAFVFCEGPGSTLGIRTSAMAIRTWQALKPRPAFAYGSLALVAEALGRQELTVIADARRDTWHCQRLGQPLRRESSAELTGELVTPAPFRNWTALPSGVASIDYDVAALFERTLATPLFRAVEHPDAFLHEEPSFKTWAPHIHRAPT